MDTSNEWCYELGGYPYTHCYKSHVVPPTQFGKRSDEYKFDTSESVRQLPTNDFSSHKYVFYWANNKASGKYITEL